MPPTAPAICQSCWTMFSSGVAIGKNMYRWVDTYTNNTPDPISTTVLFFGDLQTDVSTVVESSDSFVTVTRPEEVKIVGGSNSPVIAHVYGNNTFTVDNISVEPVGCQYPGTDQNDFDNFCIRTNLEVGPGESVSLAFFNFMAFDDTDRSGDVQLATDTANDLVSNPLPCFDGLTADEIKRIVNFTVEVDEDEDEEDDDDDDDDEDEDEEEEEDDDD